MIKHIPFIYMNDGFKQVFPYIGKFVEAALFTADGSTFMTSDNMVFLPADQAAVAYATTSGDNSNKVFTMNQVAAFIKIPISGTILTNNAGLWLTDNSGRILIK